MGSDDTEDNKTATENRPETEANQTEQAEEIVDLYTYKVKRMSDDVLIEESMLHLRVLEQGLLTAEHKYRATILFTEASQRATLEVTRVDFLTALRILNHL